MLAALITAAVLIAVPAVWAVTTVNGFRKKEIKIKESYSGIEVALTKRFDVITKLLDTCSGFLGHERDVFSETVHIGKDMGPREMITAEENMDAAAEKISAAAEKYPELGSDSVFRQLNYGLENSEAQLAAARRIYNSNVRIYNSAIASFPASLLAKKRSAIPFFPEKSGVYQDLKFTF